MSRDYARVNDKLGGSYRGSSSSVVSKVVWLIVSVAVVAALIFGLTKLYKKQFSHQQEVVVIEEPIVAPEVVEQQPQFDFFSLLSEQDDYIPAPDVAEVIVEKEPITDGYAYINVIATLNEDDALVLQQALHPLSILAGVDGSVKQVVVKKETLANREWFFVQIAIDADLADIDVIKSQLRANGVPIY